MKGVEETVQLLPLARSQSLKDSYKLLGKPDFKHLCAWKDNICKEGNFRTGVPPEAWSPFTPNTLSVGEVRQALQGRRGQGWPDGLQRRLPGGSDASVQPPVEDDCQQGGGGRGGPGC